MLHIPDSVRTLQPYLPGKPIEETQREYGLKKVVKLASNENPLGPSPKAVAAIRASLKNLHLYPDAAATRLKDALRKFHSLDASTAIAVGNGSNELIDLLIRTLCSPGDSIVTSKTAFVAYAVCAHAFGVKVVEAPTLPDLRFDLSGIVKAVRENPRARLVFLPNPNNPSGTYVGKEELRRFLLQMKEFPQVRVVIDDAYSEYAEAKDFPNALEFLGDFPHGVLVAKTFSKAYGLAALRVGYLLGEPAVIDYVERVRNPFNLNSLAHVAAEAALKDRAHVKKTVRLAQAEKRKFEKALQKLKVPFWPSQGNFILIDCQKGFGKSGMEIFQEALKKGVIFRPVANYGLPHALRITLGTAAENKKALQVLGCMR